MLQDQGSDRQPILLTVPLSPVFRLNERPPLFNFQKARLDDFAFNLDCHCPSAKEYSFLLLSSAAALFTFLTLYALLTIWCSGQTTLLLSLLAKTALACLPTALSVSLRPPFSFEKAQHTQVFPLKPPPFCSLFAGLGSTNKSAISHLFSSYFTLVLSSPPCPLLHLSIHHYLSGRNCLLSPPIPSGYNGSQDTCFSRETTRLMSWPDREHYSCPLQSLVVSLLLTLVSTLVFSRTGGVLSHQSSSIHKFPRFPLRNLCSLVMLAVFSLVFAATDTAFF